MLPVAHGLAHNAVELYICQQRDAAEHTEHPAAMLTELNIGHDFAFIMVVFSSSVLLVSM